MTYNSLNVMIYYHVKPHVDIISTSCYVGGMVVTKWESFRLFFPSEIKEIKFPPLFLGFEWIWEWWEKKLEAIASSTSS